MYTATVKFH